MQEWTTPLSIGLMNIFDYADTLRQWLTWKKKLQAIFLAADTFKINTQACNDKPPHWALAVSTFSTTQ